MKNMQEIILNNKNYILINLGKASWNPNLPSHITHPMEDGRTISEPIYTEFFDKPGSQRYIINKSEIIGMVSNILKDEDICEGLVKKVMNGQHYQNYNYKSITDRWVKTATDSLLSYLQSIDLDLTKEYLLIKNKQNET